MSWEVYQKVGTGIGFQTNGKHTVRGAGRSTEQLVSVIENLPLTIIRGVTLEMHVYVSRTATFHIICGQPFLFTVSAGLQYTNTGSVSLRMNYQGKEFKLEITSSDSSYLWELPRKKKEQFNLLSQHSSLDCHLNASSQHLPASHYHPPPLLCSTPCH